MNTFLLGMCAWLLISCLIGIVIGPYLHKTSDEAREPW